MTAFKMIFKKIYSTVTFNVIPYYYLRYYTFNSQFRSISVSAVLIHTHTFLELHVAALQLMLKQSGYIIGKYKVDIQQCVHLNTTVKQQEMTVFCFVLFYSGLKPALR